MENLVTGGPEFWQGKHVFLTGHTGFKGSWAALILSGWGAKIHGFALSPVKGIYKAADVERFMASSVIADVRDLTSLSTALAASEAEIVFHMAAQPLVRLSYETPVETYATNVMGTVNLLEACRHAPCVRAVVVVTSDKCYENREWLWGYREDEPLGGYDPYSNSKGCAELVTSAYRRSFGASGRVRISSVRAGNVIGGGDFSQDRLVPDIVRALCAGHRVRIRNPNAIRPWQHVLEPVSGYIRLAEHLACAQGELYAEAWNFGPSDSNDQTVRDIVDTSCRYWSEDASWEIDAGEQVHEASYLKLDSSKARHRLGWVPKWNFATTVRRTLDWYKMEHAGEDMVDFTKHQIEAYFGSTSPYVS